MVNLTCFGFSELSERTDKDYFSKPTFVRFLIQNRTLLGHGLPIPNVVAVLREIHGLAIAHGDVQDVMNSEHRYVELDRRVTESGSRRILRRYRTARCCSGLDWVDRDCRTHLGARANKGGKKK